MLPLLAPKSTEHNASPTRSLKSAAKKVAKALKVVKAMGSYVCPVLPTCRTASFQSRALIVSPQPLLTDGGVPTVVER